MKSLSKLIGLTALFLIRLMPAADSGIAELYRGFQDPPRQYTVRPFWFWNGKLDAKEIEWQIQQMVDQGVYGAYVHNRTGLETPYLSDEYFEVVRSAFKKSQEVGFLLGFVDEYEWPSGEARDVWIEGLPSRVVAADPEFRMRSLGYLEKEVDGPARVETEPVKDFQLAVAGKVLGDGSFDADTLADVSKSVSGGSLKWDAPAGRWRVMVFYLHPSQGRDGGLVDLLNPAAVRKFLDLSYEQYTKRFREYFGKTIDSTYVDHEGDYGYRIAWTPHFFETFQQMKGYDVRKYLPLLMYDGGKQTPKIRCDYLDLVSELYCRSFFKQVTDWCEAHGIKITGHVWEETLQMEAAFEGDLQRIMRAYAWPGVDSLWDRGRLPRDFKATGSVAHFRGTRFTCENQGLQGADSCLDFQKMRLGTNMIAAWGVDSLTPHAFNYNKQRIEYPPDWFYHEPYWKYFKHYADYARRLSYMNGSGRHVADILLFQPTETAWAHSEPVFSSKAPYIASKWNNPLDAVNTYYTNIMNRLAQERWDYDVADSHYLLEARIKDRQLAIGNESFHVLVLPPVTTIRRAALKKILEFYDRGGTVIGIHMLPSASMEEGRDDAEIAEWIRRLFGESAPGASRSNSNDAGGKAHFVKEDVEEILKLLGTSIKPDVKILDGDKSHLFYEHRRKSGVDFYWLVNDSPVARKHSVQFSIKGTAEKWDATEATRVPLYCSTTPDGTLASLRFDPWEAYYVVFSSPSASGQTLEILKTNLEQITTAKNDQGTVEVRGLARVTDEKSFFVELADDKGRRYQGTAQAPRTLPAIELDGRWSFRPESRELAAPYAVTKPDTEGQGERLGWHARDYNASDWTRTWLSRERLTVRNWWMIGPFPNEDHRGFTEVYPPEKSLDFSASYAGADSKPIRWTKWSSPGYVVDVEKALGIARAKNWVTSYAACYIYSPSARRAQFRIAANNNAKLWVNGQGLLDWHIHPFYYEMREDFALTRAAELRPGWNELLLKISKCAGARQYAFMLRVTDGAGKNFEDLVFSLEKNDGALKGRQESSTGSVWYRIPVPASAVAVRLPRFRSPVSIFYSGQQLQADSSGLVRFQAAAEGKDNVLVVRTRAEDIFTDGPQFLLGQSRMEPGSWAARGLPYYSGTAVYEREFDLEQDYVGHKLVIDCGQVGTVAEMWVNGRPAGTRVWLPYTFDISKLVHAGKNRVRIAVTNTMENARAVENHAAKLERIEPNGLVGPVRLIPYLEVNLNFGDSHRNPQINISSPFNSFLNGGFR